MLILWLGLWMVHAFSLFRMILAVLANIRQSLGLMMIFIIPYLVTASRMPELLQLSRAPPTHGNGRSSPPFAGGVAAGQRNQEAALPPSKPSHVENLRALFFLPEAGFGLQVLSLPVSVCVSGHVCIDHELVRTITHHSFKLESPNLCLCVCVHQLFCPRNNYSHVPARIIKFGPFFFFF